MLIVYMERAMVLVILLSALPLSVAALAGLVISILQTATQIQEQSVSFLVKLVAVSATLALASAWYGGEILGFSREMLETLAFLGRL